MHINNISEMENLLIEIEILAKPYSCYRGGNK